jgi:hypothetical protein
VGYIVDDDFLQVVEIAPTEYYFQDVAALHSREVLTSYLKY